MGAEYFAERLRELRIAAGLTQKDLAERAGVALRTVSALEQGLYDATFPTVLALAEALGTDCKAFTVPAGPLPSAYRGRPTKAETPAPKKKQTPKRKKG